MANCWSDLDDERFVVVVDGGESLDGRLGVANARAVDVEEEDVVDVVERLAERVRLWMLDRVVVLARVDVVAEERLGVEAYGVRLRPWEDGVWWSWTYAASV